MRDTLMLLICLIATSSFAVETSLPAGEVTQLRRELRDLKRAQQNLQSQFTKLPGKLLRYGIYTSGLTGLATLSYSTIRGTVLTGPPRSAMFSMFRMGVAMIVAGLVLYPTFSSPELVTEEEQTQASTLVYLSPVGFQHFLQLEESQQVQLALENPNLEQAVHAFYQAL